MVKFIVVALLSALELVQVVTYADEARQQLTATQAEAQALYRSFAPYGVR